MLTMSGYVGQLANLVDTEQRQIGQMQIERQEDDLLYGTFVPGPAFSSVEQLFHEFETAVEAQALHVVETLDDRITALGLSLQWPAAGEPLAVQDVQIWSDGTITCRLCEQPVAVGKASRKARSSHQIGKTTSKAREGIAGRGPLPLVEKSKPR